MTSLPKSRLIAVDLDASIGPGPSPEAEHERRVAIYDLLEENSFSLLNGKEGPYRLQLSTQEGRLLFEILNEHEEKLSIIGLSMSPFRVIVKDYFQICESYYKAIRQSTPSQIETIDMARRGLHNEGSEILKERLNGKVDIDFDTARRLFTLVCVLHWRGQDLPVPGDLPNAVLFACTQNVIRSPMAAAIMRHFYGHRVYVASAGVRPGEADPFIATVLDEIGIDLGKHRPHNFADLEDSSFDLAISLSPEAHHWALELTRTMAIKTEYWPTMDPSATAGSREQILDSYRMVRDGLENRIRARFGAMGARGV